MAVSEMTGSAQPAKTVHYLDPIAMHAARLSPSNVPAKVRAGWAWHRLVPGFTATGGTANYSRALVGPAGELAFVSDRADGQAAEGLPELHIDHTLARLSVPFAEKDRAKALGALWIGHHKTWACAPGRVSEFAQWTKPSTAYIDLMD